MMTFSNDPASSAAITSKARIAIIDDEPLNVKIVRKHLQGVGYENFVTSSEAATAMQLIAAERPDVVLLDVMMPGVDGIQIVQAIRADDSLAHLPVLILTASTDAAIKFKALEAGATDFLSKPVDPSDLIPRVRNALLVKAHYDHLASYSEQLEQKVRLRTAELELSRLQVVHCLARAGEYRDDNTGRHVIRVARFANVLARDLGFSESQATMLGTAALLHDVGKIGLPDSILLKPGPLDPSERRNMQRHCSIGQHIVEPMRDDDWLALQNSRELGVPRHEGSHQPLLELAVIISLTHHERWDGSGYPQGLAGEQIPIEGRIVAVADVFDALSSPRPYKSAMPVDRCLSIMEQERGRHFDPAVFDALIRRMEDILRIQSEHADSRMAA